MSAFKILTIDQFATWLTEQSFSREIKVIQNHHTYNPSYGDFNGKNHTELLLQMERSFLKRGFNETGQHITTFPDGKLALGRPFEHIPSGISIVNESGICLEHLGNFDECEDAMNELHKKTIVKLHAILCLQFNIEPSIDTIVYHHWYDQYSGKRMNGIGASKSCPGSNFFGGNTIQDAEENFLPLIMNNVESLKKYWPVSQSIS